MNESLQHDDDLRQRQEWMAVLATASADVIESVWDAVPDRPAWTHLRAPETGMVMVQAQAGGTGQPFNMGEMTVTRCVVRLSDGGTGHAYVAGRDARHAELAAVIDALMQVPERRQEMRRLVIDRLVAMRTEARARIARRTAATKVDFFTMVRGD
jgi:alpha-D-ribose 1-methylphosphonate 5-triphosphate synthase subunit PhnG